MKWLRSTTNKSWTAIGKTIQGVNGSWLQLTEDEWQKLSANPVIGSLLKIGGILVLDHAPATETTSVQLMQQDVAELRAMNTELENTIAQLKAELAASGASSSNVEVLTSENNQLRSDLSEANQKVESLTKELADVKEEAIKEIKERDAQIKKLEKDLKKSGD